MSPRARRRSIRRVAVVARPGRPSIGKRLRDLERWLSRRGLDVLPVRAEEVISGSAWSADPEGARRARRADLLVTLGGDGTILAGARIVAGTSIPLLPINLGGIGFLASFENGELEEALSAALDGKLVLERRSLLSSAVVRGRGAKAKLLGVALNDVVVRAATNYRALRVDVWAGETFLGHLVADGLVVASPSGSTAYSLSAGGPALAPGVEGMVVTPVCAHSLGMRPLVLPPSVVVRVQVSPRDGGEAICSLDGLMGTPIQPGETVVTALGRKAVHFLRPEGRALPIVLPHKLGWSGSPRRLPG